MFLGRIPCPELTGSIRLPRPFFLKYFADAGIACKISDTQVKGCTSLSTNGLSLVKSVTILTVLPSGFPTKKAGEHHSVGS